MNLFSGRPPFNRSTLIIPVSCFALKGAKSAAQLPGHTVAAGEGCVSYSHDELSHDGLAHDVLAHDGMKRLISAGYSTNSTTTLEAGASAIAAAKKLHDNNDDKRITKGRIS